MVQHKQVSAMRVWRQPNWHNSPQFAKGYFSRDNGDPTFTALGGNLCNNDGCNFFGFGFTLTSSPFAPPFSLDPGAKVQNMMGEDLGFSHGMSAAFPSPSEEFSDRVWATNWLIDYCNSDSAGPCQGDGIGTNAQTHLNQSVIGWPAN